MRWLKTLTALIVVGLLGWAVATRMAASGPTPVPDDNAPAPVAVADVVVGPIQLRRTFSGTLEARAEFTVAPKIGGRIKSIAVDLADSVRRGEIVAELDDAEYLQAVAQAEAELSVAQATVTEATNALEIARREFARLESLHEQDVASESQIDVVRAQVLSKEGAVAVARAQVTRAEASLEAARIRLDYAQVRASWTGPDRERVVADRYVDEGGTVSANTPILSIVSLDPITGVVFVTEQDYAHLGPDQGVSLQTDAYGDRAFTGRVSRISPVFRQNSRQARVEMTVDNPGHLLKPGMFIRAEVVLDDVPATTIVPLDALVTRDGRQGVFVLAEDGTNRVRWREVRAGIRDGRRIQVFGEGVTGRVVTLGQQLIDDGSTVVLPDGAAEAGAAAESAP